MDSTLIYDFRIARLRGAFPREFELWDQYGASSSTKEIGKIRSQVLSKTRNELGVAAASMPGVYLFTEPSGQLKYIGIAETKRRPLRNRIEDRLRHDSWFDTSLDQLTETELRAKIGVRLAASNPRANGQHDNSHACMILYYRNCDTIRLFGTTICSEAIKSAEKVLVASAVKAGFLLQNSHYRRFRGNVDKSALKLANWVVTESTDLLNSSLRSRWQQELRTFD